MCLGDLGRLPRKNPETPELGAERLGCAPSGAPPEATVLWSGRGDGARIPVVSVDLESVALWWIAGEKRVKATPGMFFGVAFPIG